MTASAGPSVQAVDSSGPRALAGSPAPLGEVRLAATAIPTAESSAGIIFGIAAYLWWGLVPLYFKAVAHVAATEVLAHRVIWSVALLALLMRFRGRWSVARSAIRHRQVLVTLAGSTTLIALNWLLYIWAVANNRVLEGSLGYFINPLVNVVLGFVFLRERLRARQYLSVALAAAGVAYLTLSFGVAPWVALALAFSFGFYGLLRKVAKVDSLVGLTLETSLLTPIALAYLAVLAARGESAFVHGPMSTSALLALAGVITAVPLLWFASAARRLRLATLGLLQYIAPTLQFFLAVAVFGERFTVVHLVSFGCIWLGLAVYAADALSLKSLSGGRHLSQQAHPRRENQHAGCGPTSE